MELEGLVLAPGFLKFTRRKYALPKESEEQLERMKSAVEDPHIPSGSSGFNAMVMRNMVRMLGKTYEVSKYEDFLIRYSSDIAFVESKIEDASSPRGYYDKEGGFLVRVDGTKDYDYVPRRLLDH